MNFVAVLLTCHNRKEKTLLCIDLFLKNRTKKNVEFDFFLTDDGSTDGTEEAVKNKYPEINIIKGNGNLFWNQGMRLAWKRAFETKKYDFYILLNDDTYLDEYALNELFECYFLFLSERNMESIVVGACRNRKNEDNFSYGLRRNYIELIPNGDLQEGNMMNGNIVIVPKNIFNLVGMLSNNYTHAMGDYDYGLRAIENNFKLITTRKYVATCNLNEGIPNWCNPKKPLFKRWVALHSPTGLNIKEYKIFIKRFWPKKYLVSIIKVYLKCFFPNLYNFFNEK